MASLVVQLVKNPSAIQETLVRLIPGSGRSSGEGIGYPLQYSWTFPSGSADKEPACSEGDLGSIPSWEDALEKGMVTHSSILAWRMPWTV